MRATPLLFDETFVHYAENTTSDTRIILFCDVERPLRTRVMTAVNRWVCRHLVRQTKTKTSTAPRFTVSPRSLSDGPR